MTQIAQIVRSTYKGSSPANALLGSVFHVISVMGFALTLVALPSVSRAAELSEVDKAIAELADPKRAARAEATLTRLITSDRDESTRIHARVALAAHKRNKGDAEAGFKLVEPYSELKAPNIRDPRCPGYYEAVRCLAAQNKLVHAYELLDYARQNAQGIAGVNARCVSADLVEPVPELKKAIEFLKEAISYGDTCFKRTITRESVGDEGTASAANAASEQWPPLKKEILARIARLERQTNIDLYGLEYVMYGEAQQFRRSDDVFATDFTSLANLYPGFEKQRNVASGWADYEQSLEWYDHLARNFPETVFGEAGKCYRCIVLAKLGRIPEAKAGLLAFHRENPTGLYRGEALKLLGDLWLQDDWDIKQAATYYEAAIKWCKEAREQARVSEIYAVPDKCATVAVAPKDWQKMHDWGGIEELKIPAGAIVNRTTAGWYLNRLQEDCEFRMGFTFAVDGKWDEALTHFTTGADLDPLLKKAEQLKYYNAAHRLKNVATTQHAFVGEAEENAFLKGGKRAAIMWADFQHLLRGWDEASSLYDRLYRAASAAGRDSEIAARAGLGMVVALMGKEDMEKARAICKEVREAFPQAASAPYVCFLEGHTYGRDINTGYASAVECYRRTYQRYPRSRVAEMAAFYEIFKGIDNKNLGQAEPMIDRFKEKYPNSKHLPTIEDYLTVVRELKRRLAEIEAERNPNNVERKDDRGEHE